MDEKIPCGTRVSNTRLPMRTNIARKGRDPRRRRKEEEEEEGLNKTICTSQISFNFISLP